MNPPAPSSSAPGVRRRLEILLPVAVTGLWTFGWLLREPGMLQGLDYLRYYSLNADWLRRSLLAGELPWWNPHVGLGRPFLGDLQTGVLYPPNLLHLVLGVPVATIVLVWLHQIGGMGGMFLLGLRLGQTRPVAWGGAALFVVLPHLSARLMGGQIHYGAALCYLPGLFWLMLRLLDRPSARRAATLAAVSALQLLCGHPQVYWLTHVGLGVFALVWVAGEGWRAILCGLAWLSGAILLGLLLTAPVLLPFLELIGESNRAASSGLLSTQGALQLRDWLGLLVPPNQAFVPDVESLVLVGAPVLLLAAVSLLHWREDRAVRALTVLALVAALLASSLPEWLHQAVTLAVPGFAGFRLPARLGVLVVLALLLLAGRCASRPRMPRALLAAAAALTVLSIAVCLPTLKQWYVLPAAYPAEPVVAGLVRELQAGDAAHVPPRLNFSARLVRENSGMLTGHSTFNGYVSLSLGRVWEYVHRAAGLPPPPTINTFPDVRIFERDPFLYNSMNFVAGFDTRTKEMRMNPSPDPRVYLAFAAENAGSWHVAIERMTQGHDFHTTALVESALPVPPGSGHGQAMIASFAHERIVLRAESSAPAVLVLAEAWYPGWSARVNGQPAPSFPVNGWMRGVVVPAGNSEIVWQYVARWFAAGCAVGAAALAVVLTALWRKEPEAT